MCQLRGGGGQQEDVPLQTAQPRGPLCYPRGQGPQSQEQHRVRERGGQVEWTEQQGRAGSLVGGGGRVPWQLTLKGTVDTSSREPVEPAWQEGKSEHPDPTRKGQGPHPAAEEAAGTRQEPDEDAEGQIWVRETHGQATLQDPMEKAGHRQRKRHPQGQHAGAGWTAQRRGEGGRAHIFIVLERKRKTSCDWSGHQDGGQGSCRSVCLFEAVGAGERWDTGGDGEGMRGARWRPEVKRPFPTCSTADAGRHCRGHAHAPGDMRV